MPRSWELRVRDILDAIDRVQALVGGLSEEEFGASDPLQRAVAYDFIVIGESSARLPAELRERHPAIPWEDMVGMRNVLAHRYFDLDPELLWSTAGRDLAGLREPLERLLAPT